MKTIIGIVLIILSIVLGLYLGLWVMFVGGIVQLIQSCTPVVNALGMAIGLLKITCASVVGWISFYILLGIGLALLR